MRKGIFAAAATLGLLTSDPAKAAEVIVLDFEGVGNLASVNSFYNGGTDSQGNAGSDFGIEFSAVSLGLIDSDSGGSGNIANEPSPNTGLIFLDGGAATMNVASGFTTGFSFFYSSVGFNGLVNVYSGLNGTGDLLASLSLPTNGGACSGDPTGTFCAFSSVGVDFNGIARSVDFGGTANQTVYDNITLGSSTAVGAVPEPGTWAMMLLGFGAIGFAMRRRRPALHAKFA